MTDTATPEPSTVHDPLSLRDYLDDMEEGALAEIVSLRDIPDLSRFNLTPDFFAVLVKIDNEYYTDTTIVDGDVKPAVGENWWFYTQGASFPHCKYAGTEETPAPETPAPVNEEAPKEEAVQG